MANDVRQFVVVEWTLRLGIAINRAEFERAHCGFRTLVGEAGHDHYRRGAQGHDLFQKVQAAHAGHFNVQRDDIGVQFLDKLSTLHRIAGCTYDLDIRVRSEEHTSELQSLMRISYAVFCLKKKINKHTITY